MNITIPGGIGDLIMIRGYLDSIKHQHHEIKVSPSREILRIWRPDDDKYPIFLEQLGKILFSDAPFKFEWGDFPYYDQPQLVKSFYINPRRFDLSHLLCKNPVQMEEPYIIITTKVRFVFKQTLFPMLNQLWQALQTASKKYKIVIMGEREVERSKEYQIDTNPQGVYSLYEQMVANLPADRIIDLTVPALGITPPNIIKLLSDCNIIRGAKCVVTVGVGGNFGLSLATAKCTLGYRNDEIQVDKNLDCVYDNKEFSDGTCITKNWSQFIERVTNV
jgi:hypothetical protein